MMKKLLIILSLVSLPALAGDFEKAAINNKYVFLYLYTPECSFCQKFNPVYNKLAQSNTNYAFVKANANELYGSSLMRKFKGRYVPYIILYNSKNKKAAEVSPACYVNDICMERALNGFKTN